MRVDFVKALSNHLNTDPRSLLISGDLGYNAFEAIAANFGKRFLNAGVAEQNMIGIAAGMALAGMHPWVYSIAPFVVYRCLEQTRNDVCLHRLPVRLVGNGGGFTYGIMGSTHYALEDLGVLKTLPNLTLIFPGTGDQVESAVKHMHDLEGPGYLRLALSGYPASAKPISENPRTLTRRYTDQGKVTVVGIGHAVQIALSALQEKLIAPGTIELFGISRYPFDLADETELVASVRRTQSVVVLDEHYLAGSIAESLHLELAPVANFQVMCARYFPAQRYGSSRFMAEQSELTPRQLANCVNSAQPLRRAS